MSCVVIRSKNGSKGGFCLSDEARQRGIEHLKSEGIRMEDVPPLIWPEDAVSAYQEHMYAPWEYTTRTDIRRRRQKAAKKELIYLREDGVSRRRALYVWVFWCPGVDGFVFRGWWTYLVGIGRYYRGGGYKGQVEGKLQDDLLRMFPLTEPNLFELNWDKWMAEFVKRFPKGRWGGKPQGKVPIWAEIQGGSVKRILSRAEWPKNNQ